MNNEEIGATLCDNCDQVIYESEFNLINDDDVVCNKCNEEIKNGDKTIWIKKKSYTQRLLNTVKI